MRKYSKNQISKIVCNCCGKELVVNRGIIREGVNEFLVEWDYFSDKDGEVHRFDICEACYDKITKTFKIDVEKIASI